MRRAARNTSITSYIIPTPRNTAWASSVPRAGVVARARSRSPLQGPLMTVESEFEAQSGRLGTPALNVRESQFVSKLSSSSRHTKGHRFRDQPEQRERHGHHSERRHALRGCVPRGKCELVVWPGPFGGIEHGKLLHPPPQPGARPVPKLRAA